MKYYILILLSLVLSSCGSSYYLSTSTNYDPIYGVTEQGDTLKIDVLDSEFDIRRKFRTDWNFRWNYSLYAQNQPYIWHTDFYYRNRLWRTGFSSWDFYWNRHDIWWNWAANFPFNNYWGYWDSTWGWQSYGFYYPNYWNERYWFRNNWRWNNRNNYWDRNRRDVVYVNGRRGSSNIVVTPNGSRRGNNIIANPNIRINRGKPNPNDVDVVIEKPKRTFIGRVFDKIENSGVRVRTYNNPNSVPTQIRNNTRNNDWNNRVVPRQNNDVIIRNNNNSRPVYNNPRPSTPVRSYSPPPSSNSGRSSGGAVISRGSRGNNNN